jgi:hypothetical protein
MQTVEVSREDWIPALNQFSVIHEGWLVSLDVLGSEIGAQPEFHDLSLLGVSADKVPEGAVVISAARSTAEHISHTIHAPTRISIERRDDGADMALQIESADGTRSILRFRAPALAQTVDGLARHRTGSDHKRG